MRFRWIPLVCTVALAACGSAPDGKGNAADAPTGRQSPRAGIAPLPPRGTDATAFVPAGWKDVRSAKADFNDDGHPDLLVILRQHDPAKVRPLNERTQETIDSNPYRIAVAFYAPATRDYGLVADDRTLISRNDDAGFVDPFNDVGVGKDSFTIKLARLANLAGDDAERRSFTFGYRDGAFRLIGLDVDTASPGEGAYVARSVNYLTHRMKVETGKIGNEAAATVKWHDLPAAPLLRLNDVGDGLAFRLPDA